MLTTILILSAEITVYGDYRVRYVPLEGTPSPKVEHTHSPKLKTRTALVSLMLCRGCLVTPGLCFSVEFRVAGSSTRRVTSLSNSRLHVNHYSFVLPDIVERLTLPVNHRLLGNTLSNLAQYPALLARLLDSPTPTMLENYIDQYSALKLHQAWHARKSLESAVLHLASLDIQTRLAVNLCKVGLPLTRTITEQRLALDIQTRCLSAQSNHFQTETRILLYLTHMRGNGVSLVCRDQIKKAVKAFAKEIDTALARLEANSAIKIVDSTVMLFNEYLLETSLHEALISIESFGLPPQFYFYEIDDCVERASLQKKSLKDPEISKAIHQCLNSIISTVYAAPEDTLNRVIPLLSKVSLHLFNSPLTIVTPVTYGLENKIAAYGAPLSSALLSTDLIKISNTVIFVLDADSLSKYEFTALLQRLSPNHRLILQASPYCGVPNFVSKVQHLISRAYPAITLMQELTPRRRSSHVYFNMKLSYIAKLLIKTKALAIVPSARCAYKLNNYIHKKINRARTPSANSVNFQFHQGDRIIFLRPQPPLNHGTTAICILLAAENSQMTLDFNGTYITVTADFFHNCNPAPCYFISTQSLKTNTIEKIFIIRPSDCERHEHYMQLAVYKSKNILGVIYSLDTYTITSPKTISITQQAMMNIIPGLVTTKPPGQS